MLITIKKINKFKQSILLAVSIVVFFPCSVGASTITYPTPGNYSFVVPVGVSTVAATISGGGGGGGGSDGNGDHHAGGGGGSGGFIAQNISVTPGQVLSITVGSGGKSGSWIFNGNPMCSVAGTTGIKNGANGTYSALDGLIATAGLGASGNTSDNGDGISGAGGTPGGFPGGPINNNRNWYTATIGGNNGSGYGTGGDSNGSPGFTICPTAGTNGVVSLTMSAAVPSASLTVNGVTNQSVAPGSILTYAWSSQNASSWSSTWSAVGTCSVAGMSGAWDANTANGGYSFPADISQVGCSFHITYVAAGPGGAKSTSIDVAVINPTTANLTANGSHNLTVTQGTTLRWRWIGVGGTSWNATWSAAGTCSVAGMSGPWDITSAVGIPSYFGGPSNGGYDYPADVSQIGCTYFITYYAHNPESQDTVIVKVVDSASVAPTAPVVTTGAASGIGMYDATLSGSVIADGSSPSTWASTRYSTMNPGTCNNFFGNIAGSGWVGTWSYNFSDPVNGLQAGTRYYYCASARNSGGYSSIGVVKFFDTLLDRFTLAVSKAGTGAGTVTSDVPGINCGATCNALYWYFNIVTLTATPQADSTFTGWSGAGCSGVGTCVVVMSQARNVTAIFTANQYPLTVTVRPTGSGTITSNPPGINCTTICTGNFSGTVTLTPTPLAGGSFDGWSGQYSSLSGNNAIVIMNAAKSVTADFIPPLPVVAVTGATTYGGSGIGTRSAYYGEPATLSWTATNAPTSCSVYRNGVFAVTYAYPTTLSYVTPVVTASSGTVDAYSVTCVNGGGMGSGNTVTFLAPIVPASLTHSCNLAGTNATMSWVLPAGYTTNYFRSYDATVKPNPPNPFLCQNDATYQCWSGAGPAAPVAQTATWSITAGNLISWWVHTRDPINGNWSNGVGYAFSCNTLMVSKAGAGLGTVSSAPAGINCGATCSATYNGGTSITLTATPFGGSTFTGWSSSTGVVCPGVGTCAVSMTQAQNVTATFAITTYILTVNKAGTGAGTVTSVPVGINCGATCSSAFNSGNLETLTATPASGSTFTGWSSSTGVVCPGVGTCVVSISQAQNVTATFALIPLVVTSCSASPSSVVVGLPVTWTANGVSGGTGSYTYLWGGTAPLAGMTTNPAIVNYPTIGSKTGTVMVTSGVQTVGPIACSATVSVVVLNPQIKVVPSAQQDFGSVVISGSKNLDFLVTNIGDAGSLLSGSVTITGADAARFVCILPCTYNNIAVGDAPSTITVRYGPIVVGGNTANANFTGGGGKVVPLLGSGSSDIVCDNCTGPGGSLDFGNVVVGKLKDLTLRIRNGGSTNYASDNIAFSPGSAFRCISSCILNLSAGAVNNVSVRFEPLAIQPYVATAFPVSYPTITFSLRGAGVLGTIKFNDQ